MKKKQMNKNGGITLIALVVTIVVLLILAGTSIAMLSGDNGIITQAQNAKLETRGADVEERVGLWKTEHELKEYSEMTVLEETEFIEDLKSKNLVFDDEINTETKIITIGSREIYYGLESPVALIKFTINETEYQAKEGMVWAEWIESEYNTNAFYLWDIFNDDRERGISRAYGFLVCANNSPDLYDAMVYESNEIIENHAYRIRGVTECVYPDSNILTNIEGQTTLAKEMKENDEIIYFDFEENTMKEGKVSKVYVHKDATSFVKYIFEDGSYLEATDYHPIYTKEGWKSQTQRNGYEMPKIGDEVKTPTGWKVITKIETWEGLEDCYDFEIISEEGERVNNYFANGTLVQGSY